LQIPTRLVKFTLLVLLDSPNRNHHNKDMQGRRKLVVAILVGIVLN
jgi:hypothetical protein